MSVHIDNGHHYLQCSASLRRRRSGGAARASEQLYHRNNPRHFRMRAFRVIFRVTLALFGGYAASAVWSAVLALGLRNSIGAGEATVLAAMLAFILFLLALLWITTTPRLARAGLLTVGATLVGVGLSRWLSAGAWPTLAALGVGG